MEQRISGRSEEYQQVKLTWEGQEPSTHRKEKWRPTVHLGGQSSQGIKGTGLRVLSSIGRSKRRRETLSTNKSMSLSFPDVSLLDSPVTTETNNQECLYRAGFKRNPVTHIACRWAIWKISDSDSDCMRHPLVKRTLLKLPLVLFNCCFFCSSLMTNLRNSLEDSKLFFCLCPWDYTQTLGL